MLGPITLNNSMDKHTNMKEKYEIKRLFFNKPSRQWHFEEILRESGMSRSQTNQWLKKLLKEGIISRKKKKGKMPYYTGNFNSPAYRNCKKIYALQQLYDCGLLNHLQSLKKADSVVIFGSFARADWNKESDIDIFIYGDDKNLEQGKFELKLQREIQIFKAKKNEDLKNFQPGLLKNIANGYIVKGDLNFLEVRCQN